MNQKLNYETPQPGRYNRVRVRRAVLNLSRAILLLVMGTSGFYSWLIWNWMSEANVTLGTDLTLFERSLAVFIISLICFCATLITRKQKNSDPPAVESPERFEA